MGNLTAKRNHTRHAFLRTLFPNNDQSYAVLHMNGFVLVRQFNASNNEWEVAIYTSDSYSKVEHWKETRDREKVDRASQE